MKGDPDERAVRLGEYIVDTGATVRDTAGRFGLSKSTVHKDITERLRHINPGLAAQARRILDLNKSERHIRGGRATREKYLCRKTSAEQNR
jgi:putative DeoR family transcriptional regulator (stage III sporulation protein D)